jgi:hypothetical protein
VSGHDEKVVGVRGDLKRIVTDWCCCSCCLAETVKMVEKGGKWRQLKRVVGGIEGARRQDQTKWAAGRSYIVAEHCW